MGCRLMIFWEDWKIREGAELFAQMLGESELAADIARVLLLEVGKRVVTEPVLLLSNDFITEHEEIAEVLDCAGAYLVQNGIQDVDAVDISDVPIEIVWDGKNMPIEIVWELDEVPIGPLGRGVLKGMGFTNRTRHRVPVAVPVVSEANSNRPVY